MGVFTALIHSRCPSKRPCTDRIHGCSRRVYGPGTRPYMTRTRPCTRPIHGRVLWTRSYLHHVYTAVHGRESTVYTVVHGPCTVHGRVPCTLSSLRPVYTAVNAPGARPCTCYVPCTRSCLRFHEHGSFCGRCTRPCTDPVHGHARAVYTAVYTAVNSRVYGQQPCTRSVHGGHGRERLCTLSVNTEHTPVYTVHGRVDMP